MTAAIPRALVARALGVSEDSLPEGELPMARLAERYATFLAGAARDEADPAELWTFDVMDRLAQEEPALALAAIRATLPLCTTPGEVAHLAAGPLETLLQLHGPEVIGPLAEDPEPRMLYALTGVWLDDVKPMVRARVEALRRDVPGLDDEAPLP